MAVIIHRYQGGSLSVRSFAVFEVKRKFWLIALALTALCGPSAIALDRAHFVELNQKAAELRKKQDWPVLREMLVEIGRDIPGLTPRYMLRMASVETHLQHMTEALRWLERYAATGLTYDIAGDPLGNGQVGAQFGGLGVLRPSGSNAVAGWWVRG